MGADEDLEQVVHKPTTEEEAGGKHAARADESDGGLDEVREAGQSEGSGEPAALKANMKLGTKQSGTDAIETEKANLK